MLDCETSNQQGFYFFSRPFEKGGGGVLNGKEDFFRGRTTQIINFLVQIKKTVSLMFIAVYTIKMHCYFTMIVFLSRNCLGLLRR